jgi:hypothetical protein
VKLTIKKEQGYNENGIHEHRILCTCSDCEAEVAMQQFVLEERLMVEAQQEFENAFRQPPANCPYCKAVLSPNDRNALKREVLRHLHSTTMKRDI